MFESVVSHSSKLDLWQKARLLGRASSFGGAVVTAGLRRPSAVASELQDIACNNRVDNVAVAVEHGHIGNAAGSNDAALA